MSAMLAAILAELDKFSPKAKLQAALQAMKAKPKQEAPQAKAPQRVEALPKPPKGAPRVNSSPYGK